MESRKILITGANSYIGTSFEKYMQQWSNDYVVDTIDMIDGSWRKKDFSQYDVVYHVAGLAHADVGNVSEEIKRKYYAINTDLTIETAAKAKNEGVKQFIFMSSIIVYGESAPVGKSKMITPDTKPTPANFYGDSKLQADIGLEKLRDESFKVCIVRPPMIYGPNSKGNYPLLAKLAKKLPVFPDIKNGRSMLFVGNLVCFIKQCIDECKDGIFYPQNDEYVTTSDLVREIARVHTKKIWITPLLNPFVHIACRIPGKIGGLCNKAFGSITYTKDNVVKEISFKNSIELTEGYNE